MEKIKFNKEEIAELFELGQVEKIWISKNGNDNILCSFMGDKFEFKADSLLVISKRKVVGMFQNIAMFSHYRNWGDTGVNHKITLEFIIGE